jgi:hypothetical protein
VAAQISGPPLWTLPGPRWKRRWLHPWLGATDILSSSFDEKNSCHWDVRCADWPNHSSSGDDLIGKPSKND